MKKILLLLMTFCFVKLSYGQHTVTGTVMDESAGQPLPGVSILVKGSSAGTTTNVEGEFTLEVANGDETLIFSFIGFTTQEVPLNNRTRLDVSMEENLEELQEVVVIGYGTQKKKLVTGATVNVDGEKLNKLSNTNALQSLQGQTAGVNITSTSGQPGAGFEVNIRGIGSNGDANPLYIVDGVITNDISYLNNADIESIDVLKDAASAAIYGARGGNGVVLVTTKQGSEGKTRVSFDSYYGVQTIRNKTEMLDAREYATIMNEQAVNSGKQPYYSTEQLAQLGEGTNWLDEILIDDAVTQNYSIGLQGGNKQSVYSASFSYTQQEGIIGGADYSNYERYVARINSDHKLLNGRAKIGENLTFTYIDQIGIPDQGQYYNNFRGAFNTHPLMPVYDSLGNLYNNASAAFIDNGAQSNPYASLVYNNQREGGNQRLVGNVYAEVDIIENLKFRTSFGIVYGAGQSRSFTPEHELSIYTRVDTSSVTQSANKDFSWLWENTLSYKVNLGANQIEVLAGTAAQQERGSSLSATNANLSFDSFKYAYLDNTTYANGNRMSVSGGAYENALLSYFGRVLYNYDEKYLLNVTFRADGSAKFAEGHRWGYFPSVSGGWVVTNEGFIKRTQMGLEFFKIRASWGQNGNNRVPGFRFVAPITLANTNYILGQSEGSLTPGAFPSRLANPALQWETSEMLDIGFDAEFLNGRLFSNFDWYQKTTKNWLIQPPILATAGAEAPWVNGGSVVNTGVELVVGWRERRGAFNYSISANAAFNDNEVKEIPTASNLINGESNELWNNAPEFYRAEEGFPIGYFWGYETLGVFQNEQEIQNYTNAEGQPIQPSARPGDLIYRDTNNDGSINNDDKTMIGDPNPDLVYGFNITMDYKGFDLTINANGVAGNQLVQSYRNATDQFANYPKEILGRWHGEGSSNKLPRLTEDGRNYTRFSDIYIKDGDFLRINNITLGYDLSDLINNEVLSQVRVFVTGQNLFTFTKYTGMDPEIGYGQTFSSGVDIGYYPRPSVLMGGLNVKF
jgi:TonB-linked SusC/RagA family outer membrane protein